MFASILLVCAIVFADQAVKHWASTTLKAVGSIPVIDGVFHLTYAENTGAAFSLLAGKHTFFLLATVVALVILFVMLRQGYFKGRAARLAILFIMGGALGNFIDRLHLAYVIDLFDFRLINFAIFNVADIFINCGGALLVLSVIAQERRERRAARMEAGDAPAPEDQNEQTDHRD